MPFESVTLSDRIRTILRRDLKVAADLPLEEDAPLFGPATDLDSLDALLLVTSIEKEFRIKIPSESIGRDVFRSIRALGVFVKGQLENPAAAASTQGAVDPDEALRRLPHGEPFRFVTRVTALAAGEAGQGVWSVTGSEPFFAGHFPGDPIVPGVLIAEALAQLSGIVAAAGQEPGAGAPAGAARVAHLDIRYRAVARPPAEIALESRLKQRAGSVAHFEVRAVCQEQVLAEGSLAMGFE